MQFDLLRLPGISFLQIQDLASGRYIQVKVCILIVGPCGAGKSHDVRFLRLAVLPSSGCHLGSTHRICLIIIHDCAALAAKCRNGTTSSFSLPLSLHPALDGPTISRTALVANVLATTC